MMGEGSINDISTRSSMAVIGAGLSGLRAANILSSHGHQVSVFEKTSRPGGRLGAWEWEGTIVDAGAQYFTARDALFRRHVTSWIQEGVVSRWGAILAAVDAPGIFRKLDNSLDRYVGVPGMGRVAEHLSKHVDIRFECHVDNIAHHDDKFHLTHANGNQAGAFDALIIATPASQAISLLPADSELVPAASGVRMVPCWAVMAVFHKPFSLPFDGLFFNGTMYQFKAKMTGSVKVVV